MEPKGMRERLLATVAASREREHELLAMCDDSPPPEPGVWTVKDHLAHLSAWRIYAAQVLDAVRTGAADQATAEDEIDAKNERIYEANKNKSADEIKDDARSTYHTLHAAIAACSDDDLAKPRPRVPGALVWQVVPGNSHYHLAEHLMFWHLEQGDEESAEVAQQWVYDLERTEFPEPDRVAAATYNLACFYSRVGRADEVLHRLKQAFELDPSLKKNARTDGDLDRVRSDPAVAALLA